MEQVLVPVQQMFALTLLLGELRLGLSVGQLWGLAAGQASEPVLPQLLGEWELWLDFGQL